MRQHQITKHSVNKLRLKATAARSNRRPIICCQSIQHKGTLVDRLKPIFHGLRVRGGGGGYCVHSDMVYLISRGDLFASRTALIDAIDTTTLLCDTFFGLCTMLTVTGWRSSSPALVARHRRRRCCRQKCACRLSSST